MAIGKLTSANGTVQDGNWENRNFVESAAATSAAEAAPLLEALCAQGNSQAMLYLGLLYEAGQGVTKNINKAIEYWKKASELGSGMASGILAEMYQKGNGAARNINEAFKWYKKAADMGNVQAKGLNIAIQQGSIKLSGNGSKADIMGAIDKGLMVADILSSMGL